MFLGDNGRIADAFIVLDQADALGAPALERLLTRARLQLQSHQIGRGARDAGRGRARRGVDDPRLACSRRQLLVDAKGAAGADEALAILDVAATRYPTDLAVQRCA